MQEVTTCCFAQFYDGFRFQDWVCSFDIVAHLEGNWAMGRFPRVVCCTLRNYHCTVLYRTILFYSFHFISIMRWGIQHLFVGQSADSYLITASPGFPPRSHGRQHTTNPFNDTRIRTLWPRIYSAWTSPTQVVIIPDRPHVQKSEDAWHKSSYWNGTTGETRGIRWFGELVCFCFTRKVSTEGWWGNLLDWLNCHPKSKAQAAARFVRKELLKLLKDTKNKALKAKICGKTPWCCEEHFYTASNDMCSKLDLYFEAWDTASWWGSWVLKLYYL